MAEGSTEQGTELAEINRLCAEIARAKGVTHHFVLNQLMLSSTWKTIGGPDVPQDLNAWQAHQCVRVLERWLCQAKSHPPMPRRRKSPAPVPPWATRTVPTRPGAETGKETDI